MPNTETVPQGPFSPDMITELQFRENLHEDSSLSIANSLHCMHSMVTLSKHHKTYSLLHGIYSLKHQSVALLFLLGGGVIPNS